MRWRPFRGTGSKLKDILIVVAIIAAALLLFTDWGAAILATEVGW